MLVLQEEVRSRILLEVLFTLLKTPPLKPCRVIPAGLLPFFAKKQKCSSLTQQVFDKPVKSMYNNLK